MSDLKDLKAAANPYTQLTKAVNKTIEQNKEIISQNEIQITLLARLCELKETQQKNDTAFRDSWAAAKIKDTWLGIGVLTIASVALYLDYFRGWPVFKWLKSLIG